MLKAFNWAPAAINFVLALALYKIAPIHPPIGAVIVVLTSLLSGAIASLFLRRPKSSLGLSVGLFGTFFLWVSILSAQFEDHWSFLIKVDTIAMALGILFLMAWAALPVLHRKLPSQIN